MRMFKTEKEQIQEDKDKRYIKIPIPQRFYCMEHKIYETPQEFNEELNRRTQASDFRNKVAYEKGREETAREILRLIQYYDVEHPVLSRDDVYTIIANKYNIDLGE